VGERLGRRGIAHRVLPWRPCPGLRGVQAAARQARYALLAAWCESASCLHLLLGHHREDQAETLLLRLARGSGLDGLAAMSPIRETAAGRLLRPVLAVPRTRLCATLAAAGIPAIADPSNENPAFARIRLRRSAAILDREGLGPARLAATARRLGRARQALEERVAHRLACAVALHPTGFARLDAVALCAGASEVGLRALARLVATIGGAEHAARLDRLERLYAALAAGPCAARTLGGCRFLPWRGAVLVCREPRATAPPLPLAPGKAVRWDGRFSVRLAPEAPADLSIAALGEWGMQGLCGTIPAAARPTLPSIRDLVGILAVPHLHYERADRRGVSAFVTNFSFRPERVLAGAGFTVV
ncbi:MAG: tRNA lysidine(34) synthetase TilS, partial [Alphaproteobacteria bacterium]|nr:tRNA lysidine(34) synthetase TilS [Alphaproteobacteria bacterium]